MGERLPASQELPAVPIFEEDRAAGYSGGITQLRDLPAGCGRDWSPNRWFASRPRLDSRREWISRRSPNCHSSFGLSTS